MTSALFLGLSLSVDWVLHATLIEGECQQSRLGFTANFLRLVNVPWHASTTPVHGRDCQNTAVVAGEFAAELGP